VDYDAESYGAVWADLYDEFFGDRDDLDVVVETLDRLAGNGRVLEFGIGTGRIAIPLAERGLGVHGVEISQPMVDKLRAKPGGAELAITVGDFTEVEVEGEFGLVLLAFSSIFLLESQEDQVRCVANAARHLGPGGVFVVEAFVPDPSRWTRGQNISVVRVEDDLVDLSAGLHDPVEQVIRFQRILLRESGLELLPNRIRYVWPSELDLMARLAGFRLRERWGGWRGEPFSAESGAHISIYELP
jgi:SAM-dependent methyltransferase